MSSYSPNSRDADRDLRATYPSSSDVSKSKSGVFDNGAIYNEDVTHHHTAPNKEIAGENNVINLKIQLQEAFVKLEERNLLISKAKHAMESLSHEVNRLRLEVTKGDDNESKFREQRKLDAEEIAALTIKCSSLEHDILELKTVLRERDDIIESQSDHCEQKESSLSMLLLKLEESREDYNKIERERMLAENRCHESENELASVLAQIEVYKLQYEQSRTDAERLGEEVASKDKQINDCKSKIEESNAKYGMMIGEKQDEYLRRMEQMINAHNIAIDEVEKRAADHINKMEQKTASDIIRMQSTLEKGEEREAVMKSELSECMSKIPPLNEIIDRKKSEIYTLQQELLLTKDENGRIKTDNSVYITKIANLEISIEKYKEVKIKDDLEKVEQQFKTNQLKDNLELTNKKIVEMTDNHNHNQSIHAANALELNDLKIRIHTMEDIVRENERLKVNMTQLVSQNDILNTELTTLRAEHESQVDKSAIQENEYSQMIATRESMNQQVYIVKDANKNLEVSLSEERQATKTLTVSLGLLTERYNVEKLMRAKLLGHIEECVGLVDKVDVAVRSVLEESSSGGDDIVSSTPMMLPSTDDPMFVPPVDLVYTGLSRIQHSVSKRSDRIQTNLDRIKRLKNVFDAKVKSIVSSHEKTADLFHTKYNLFMAKLQEKDTKIDMLKQTLDRDQAHMMHMKKHVEDNHHLMDNTIRQHKETTQDIEKKHKETMQDIEKKHTEKKAKHLAEIERQKHNFLVKEQELTNRISEIEADNKRMIEKLSEKYETKALILATESKEKYQTFETSMHSKIDDKDRQIQILVDKVSEQVATITELEALSKGLAGDIEEYMKSDEDKNRDTHATVENYKAEIMKLEENSHQMISKFNGAMSECGRLSHELKNSQEEYRVLQIQYSDLLNSFKSLESQSDEKLGTSGAIIMSLQEKIENLQTRFDQLDMLYDEKSRECVHANATITDLQTRIGDLELKVVDPDIQKLLHETNHVFQSTKSRSRRQSYAENVSVEPSDYQINALVNGNKQSHKQQMADSFPTPAASVMSETNGSSNRSHHILSNNHSPSNHTLHDAASMAFGQHKLHDHISSHQRTHHHQPKGPISPIPYQSNHATAMNIYSQSSTPSHSNSSFMTGPDSIHFKFVHYF